MKALKKQQLQSHDTQYERFKLIDGRHRFQQAVPNGYVFYSVRTLPGGKIAYFNFDLAKEMGLISADHSYEMNPQLAQAVLDAFSIQIINEYDLLHQVPIPLKDIRPHKYMATRYLQLQHPDKRGLTSGDGRSIWNGELRSKGNTWDITSCGTGATRLSPATALHKKFYKTGDPQVCYGCGKSDLSDGISAAIMSEIFHRNRIPTERTLAVIEFDNKYSINVRASQCLMRPAHIFLHFKQENLHDLKAAVDFYIDRQKENLHWPDFKNDQKKYEFFVEETARLFARAVARYESDYIFVWMDWDGDNILMNGGIIDYGSIRQFGLCHFEYRYDDVERWSTNLLEQKNKARDIIQTFAQIRDYLIDGTKTSKSKYKKDHLVKLFDDELQKNLSLNFLYRLGLNQGLREYLFKFQLPLVNTLRKSYLFFERTKSSCGPYMTEDGKTWDAIFNMRNLLRGLPSAMLVEKLEQVSAEKFHEMMLAQAANKKDRKLTRKIKKEIIAFQKNYKKIVEACARDLNISPEKILREMTMRSSLINRPDRITGDAIIEVTEILLRQRKNMSFNETQKIIDEFVEYQKIVPKISTKKRIDEIRQTAKASRKKSGKILTRLMRVVNHYREDL